MLLGIRDGFSPAADHRVGQQFAPMGRSSQEQTLAMIGDQLGTRIGTDKLRRLVGTLAGGIEPLREEAQVHKLITLVSEARGRGQTPVLPVGLNGVALGLARWSLFEMASVACVSVGATQSVELRRSGPTPD